MNFKESIFYNETVTLKYLIFNGSSLRVWNISRLNMKLIKIYFTKKMIKIFLIAIEERGLYCCAHIEISLGSRKNVHFISSPNWPYLTHHNKGSRGVESRKFPETGSTQSQLWLTQLFRLTLRRNVCLREVQNNKTSREEVLSHQLIRAKCRTLPMCPVLMNSRATRMNYRLAGTQTILGPKTAYPWTLPP